MAAFAVAPAAPASWAAMPESARFCTGTKIMAILKYDGSAAAVTAAPSQSFFGTGGVDTLTGTSANESFWGAEGDRMIGGGGDDTYYLQNFANQFVETGADPFTTRLPARLLPWSGIAFPVRLGAHGNGPRPFRIDKAA